METVSAEKEQRKTRDGKLSLIIKSQPHVLEGSWDVEVLSEMHYTVNGSPITYDYFLNIDDSNSLIYPDDLDPFLEFLQYSGGLISAEFRIRIINPSGEVKLLKGRGYFRGISTADSGAGSSDKNVDSTESTLRETYDLMESVIQSDIIALSVLKPVVSVEGEIEDFEWVMSNKLLMAMAGGRNVIGRRFTTVFPLLEENGVLAIIKEVMLTGQRRSNEFFYRGLNVKGWFRAVYARANGYVIVSAEEITNAKRAEFELKASRRKLEAAFNVSSASLFILKSIRSESRTIIDFDLDWMNAAAVTTVGFDATGHRFLGIFPSLNTTEIFSHFKDAVFEERSFEFEAPHAREDITMWLSWKVVKLDDGLFVSAEDITERKKATDNLSTKYRVLQETEEVASIGSWEYISAEERFNWSPGMYRLFQISEGEIVKPDVYLKYAVEEDRPVAERILEKFSRPASFQENIRIKLGRKVKALTVKATVLPDEHGALSRLVGVDFDITGLVESNRLKEINSSLKELDEAKTKFFVNVSHEFRTPLTLMLGPLYDLIQNTKLHLSPQRYAELEMAYRNTVRLQKLVNTLLDFSRIEAGKLDAYFQPTNIADVTADLAGVFRSAIEAAGLKFKVETQAIPEPVYLNREMWEKIILNLLSNAFKFTHSGKISVSVHDRSKYVLIKVKDTGIGISPHNIKRIFERFTRIEGVHARTNEGSGIGLALVQELVLLHGGTIKVKSAEGEGSEFLITIPKGKSHLPPKQVFENHDRLTAEQHVPAFVEESISWVPEFPRKNSRPYYAQNKRNPPEHTLLFADDNADMRRYMEHVMGREFRVVAVENGTKVIEKLDAGLCPDLILTDVMMPVMDGFRLITVLKQRPEYANIPVVLLSARSGEDAKIEGMESGADDYLSKPFSSRELMVMVRARIQIAEARKNAETTLKNNNAELERRVAERTSLLEESELLITKQHRHLHKILNAIPQMVWVLDPEGKISFVNERWYAYTGVTEEQCFDRHHLKCDIFHPCQQNELLTRWNESVDQKTSVTSEMLIRGRNGEYRWHLGMTEPIGDEEGNVEMWVGTFTDVHDQFVVEHQVKETKNLLEAVFNSSFDCISVFDAVYDEEDRIHDFRWKYVNEQMKKFSGQDLVGRTLRNELTKGELETLLPMFQVALETSSPIQFESQMNRGGKRYIYNTVVKLGDGLVLTQQDITERVKFRQSLVRLNESLRQKNQSLKMMNDELGTFAYIASHDLREPLRKIRLFMDQLLTRGVVEINPQGQTYAQKVLSATLRMNALIDGILAFSRLNGSAPFNRQDIDLGQLMSNVIADLHDFINMQKAEIEFAGLGNVSGDVLQISQLFSNLIRNAITFQPKGNCPKVEISRKEIAGKNIDDAAANPHGKYISITVKDNGIGFNEEYASKIFALFQRLHVRSEYPGTGIGLAICKRVMENHHGFITVKSIQDEGSMFTVYFPVRSHQEPSA